MAKTLFDKIWDGHVIADLGNGFILLHIDRLLLHDMSGGKALKEAIETCGKCSVLPQLHKDLGLIYCHSGNFKNGRIELLEAQKLSPGDEDVAKALRLLELAGLAGVAHGVVQPRRGRGRGRGRPQGDGQSGNQKGVFEPVVHRESPSCSTAAYGREGQSGSGRMNPLRERRSAPVHRGDPVKNHISSWQARFLCPASGLWVRSHSRDPARIRF